MRQIVEIDPVNGVFAIILDGNGGIILVRLDLVTGDYKILSQEKFFSNSNNSIKSIVVLPGKELLIVKEPFQLNVEEALINQKNGQPVDEVKFRAAIIKTNLQLHTKAVKEVPLRVHQIAKPPAYDVMMSPYVVVQIYTELALLNTQTMELYDWVKLPPLR